MKTFVLACSAFALSISAFAQDNGKTTAQAVSSARPMPQAASQRVITKTEFTTRAEQLDANIAQGKMDAAKNAWGSVKSMMVTVINNTRMQLAKATPNTDKASATKVAQTQRTLYGEALRLSQSDLGANRAALHDKLSQFANTISQ